jgi:UDP-N-acetylmuramoylalanine--D-glutamate ligase
MHDLVLKRADLAYSYQMQSIHTLVEGKKITVMGLGVLGRGVGDVEFLAQCGAQVLVTDKKTESELVESVARLKQYPNVSFHLGEHQIDDFTHCDLVFKAAGVPIDSPYIAAARAAGIPVYMSTAVFARYAMKIGATVVGITGTRGKSTVTQMIYSVLLGVRDPKTIHLGGNIRGLSTLALLPRITPGDIVVLELDSWQLQGFGDLEISPNISVFTNLMPDHQNYYRDMDEYFADKANIFAYQKNGDVLICGQDIEQKITQGKVKPSLEPRVVSSIPDSWHLKVPGVHNRENASLAAEVLRALHVSDEAIRTGLESFAGVAGRLQLVTEIKGVKIYNDNNATTPDATIAGLRALDTGKKQIVLIMGGADKGLDMSNLLYEIARSCKRVICLAGTGTARITPFMQDYSIYDNLKSAVDEALASAESGDVILFSPAFASFGMFTNEYERNDKFMSIIKDLA